MPSSRDDGARLEQTGLPGSIISALCCLGFAAFLSILSSIGAGFLINDFILAPLLVVFLFIGGLGLKRSAKRYNSSKPFYLHIAASLVILIFTFAKYIPVLAWLGIAALIAVPIWSFWLLKNPLRAQLFLKI